MKEDKQDVRIPCLGFIRGCLVAHCDIAGVCMQNTLMREKAEKIWNQTT